MMAHALKFFCRQCFFEDGAVYIQNLKGFWTSNKKNNKKAGNFLETYDIMTNMLRRSSANQIKYFNKKLVGQLKN